MGSARFSGGGSALISASMAWSACSGSPASASRSIPLAARSAAIASRSAPSVPPTETTASAISSSQEPGRSACRRRSRISRSPGRLSSGMVGDAVAARCFGSNEAIPIKLPYPSITAWPVSNRCYRSQGGGRGPGWTGEAPFTRGTTTRPQAQGGPGSRTRLDVQGI